MTLRAGATGIAGPLIGDSVAFREVTEAIAMVAPVDSAVLLFGETGTGKEVIARAIHDAGARRHERFVAVNCAAIPGGLLESELFGHGRGAFTGAVSQTVGRFQAADRGTLFLDEVGDLPLELQPKLLRALQEPQIERLGSGGRATLSTCESSPRPTRTLKRWFNSVPSVCRSLLSTERLPDPGAAATRADRRHSAPRRTLRPTIRRTAGQVDPKHRTRSEVEE